jgi:serine/threonine-protein kinase RsbW
MTSPGVMTPDVVHLKVPGQPQYVGVVRLAVAGLANQLDFPFDEAEDLKLAVTEACSFVLRSARYKIDLRVDFQFSREQLEIHVQSSVAEPLRPNEGSELGADADLDVGMSLVEALMDNLEMETDEGTGAVSVTMTRRFPSIDNA